MSAPSFELAPSGTAAVPQEIDTTGAFTAVQQEETQAPAGYSLWESDEEGLIADPHRVNAALSERAGRSVVPGVSHFAAARTALHAVTRQHWAEINGWEGDEPDTLALRTVCDLGRVASEEILLATHRVTTPEAVEKVALATAADPEGPNRLLRDWACADALVAKVLVAPTVLGEEETALALKAIEAQYAALPLSSRGTVGIAEMMELRAAAEYVHQQPLTKLGIY